MLCINVTASVDVWVALGNSEVHPYQNFTTSKKVFPSLFFCPVISTMAHVLAPSPALALTSTEMMHWEVHTREDGHSACVAALREGSPHQLGSIRAATDRTHTPVSMHVSLVDS